MTDQGFSIIRVELERAALSFRSMLTTAMAERDAEVQRAIEEACSPENVTRVVQREVSHAMETAIREEVERYFRYGSGRATVREAIIKQMGEP